MDNQGCLKFGFGVVLGGIRGQNDERNGLGLSKNGLRVMLWAITYFESVLRGFFG